MTLVRGNIVALRGHAERGTFNSLTVLETHKGEIIRMIPRLLRSGEHPRVLYRDGVRHARLKSPYTLDGELVGGRKGQSPLDVVVEGSDMAVRGVWLS